MGSQGVPRFDRVGGHLMTCKRGEYPLLHRKRRLRNWGSPSESEKQNGGGYPLMCPERGVGVRVLVTPWWGSGGSPDLKGWGYPPLSVSGGCHPAAVRDLLKNCNNRTKARGVNTTEGGGCPTH